jgi:hypothetical protein
MRCQAIWQDCRLWPAFVGTALEGASEVHEDTQHPGGDIVVDVLDYCCCGGLTTV